MAIRHRSRNTPAIAIVTALVFAFGLFWGACGGDDGGAEGTPTPAGADGPGPTVVRAEPEGEPRTVRLGLSSLPPELTSDAYIQAFATAAQYAETILIQRNPPWRDFLPGARSRKRPRTRRGSRRSCWSSTRTSN
ncbi:MAG: hypothetical protein M5U18_14310 [Dehalococcoidia bacterium]|nr:hypothetical protein [Dehalococcoidia bacterium]